jgi:hypothetical protein
MTARLEKAIKKLTPEEVEQVADFAEFLVRHKPPAGKSDGGKSDWRGALSHLKDRYTSVELQHLANKWRDEELSR